MHYSSDEGEEIRLGAWMDYLPFKGTSSRARRKVVPADPSYANSSRKEAAKQELEKILGSSRKAIDDWTRNTVVAHTLLLEETTVERKRLMIGGIQSLVLGKYHELWDKNPTKIQKEEIAVQIFFTCLIGIVFFIHNITSKKLEVVILALKRFESNIHTNILVFISRGFATVPMDTPSKIMQDLVKQVGVGKGTSQKIVEEIVQGIEKKEKKGQSQVFQDYTMLSTLALQLLSLEKPRKNITPTNVSLKACAACTCVQCGKLIKNE
jgi:hypothetical protein